MQRAFVILFIILFSSPAFPSSALEGVVKFVSKENTFVFLEVAATDEERTKGLMGRKSLDENRGMVFVFRPEREVSFWMKDTLIQLDMIFINRGKIIKVAKNVIPNRTDILYPSDNPVTEVVEVNGGFADRHMIEAGDSVVFENVAEIDYSKKPELKIIIKH